MLCIISLLKSDVNGFLPSGLCHLLTCRPTVLVFDSLIDTEILKNQFFLSKISK